jgi:hypothetical protein
VSRGSAKSDSTDLHSCTDFSTEDNHQNVRESQAHSLPLKIGFPAKSSAKIQPTDHTSIAEAWGIESQPAVLIPNHTQPKFVTHVVCKAEHDLRCAIPPRRDIFGHEPLLLRLIEPARESKIANLELAVRVHEQVARLEIAVQYVGRVDVFQTAERLVNEGLEVRVRERLAGADLLFIIKEVCVRSLGSAANKKMRMDCFDARWREGRLP